MQHRVTLRDFELWLTQESYAPRTRKRYLKIVRGFLEEYGEPDLITARDMKHWRNTIEFWRDKDGQVHPSSAVRINQQRSAIKAFFQYLLACGKVQYDLSTLVRTRSVPKRLPKPVDSQEIRQILTLIHSRLGTDPQALQDRALIEVLYGSGLRREEAAGLRLRMLESRDSIRVVGKGDKERLVPVTAAEFTALKELVLSRYREEERLQAVLAEFGEDTAFFDLCRRHPEAPLFFSETGRAYLDYKDPGQQVWLRVKHYARELGLDLHPHRFRHSYATTLIENGADLLSVSESLGHSSVSTTQSYTQVAKHKLLDLAHRHGRNSL